MDAKIIEGVQNFIKNYVLTETKSKGVVLGMSGGKDSLVTAKLCANALGKDKVLGIIMPNGEMKDCEIAIDSCKIIGIRYYIIDINNIYNSFIDSVKDVFEKELEQLSTITTFNIPPRIRMTMLYAIAGSMGYLVANTSNLSEKEVGYTTKWGDNVGDIAPLVNFTKNEVCEIGLMLGLPEKYVNKVPDDGLSGQSDEEKLGFSYSQLDNLIRKGEKGDEQGYQKIMQMHRLSEHKRKGTKPFENDFYNYFDDEKDF